MSRDTALVVIDVQAGMFSASDPVYQGDELLTRIGQLLEKARRRRYPSCIFSIQANVKAIP